MTETIEVAARPATGPSSTSIRMTVFPKAGAPVNAEWPAEWRIPVVDEMVRFGAIGVGKVSHVLWDHEDGVVTLWLK